ncbi:MAG: ATP synthase subunit I [Myxococcota bacterium]
MNGVLQFALGLVSGFAIGLAYFRALWLTVQSSRGGSPSWLVSFGFRYLGAGLLLLALARLGLTALLAGALGFTLARLKALHRYTDRREEPS